MRGFVDLVLILVLGVVAGTISGIVGFGASIMLMPVLVIVYGPLVAVPIMAIVANSRIMGRFRAKPRLIVLGWLGTGLMTLAVLALFGSFFAG